jgi:hypothetical protein
VADWHLAPSLVVHEAWEVMAVALFGKNSFPVTGDGSACGEVKGNIARRPCTLDLSSAIRGCIVSVALVPFCSLSVLPISLATAIGVVVRGLGWEHWLVRALIPLPVISIFVLILSGCPGLASGSLIPSAWPL